MSENVTLSTLVCDREAIDWDKIKSLGKFISYDIPLKQRYEWDKLHIHYLKKSQHPYYYYSHKLKFYVLHPLNQEVQPWIGYDNQEWASQILNPQDMELHVLVKLFISHLFKERKSLLSNNDYYLLIKMNPKKNFAAVMKIQINDNWKDGRFNEFTFRDDVTTLRRYDAQNPLDSWQACYQIDYYNDLSVLRRQVPGIANKQNVFVKRDTSKNFRNFHTSIPYLNVRSLDALEKSRMYWFDKFMRLVVSHFNQNGIPCNLKEVTPHSVHTIKSSKKFNQPQIVMNGRNVVIYDDRFRRHHAPELEQPSNYHDELITVIRNIIENESWTPELIVKSFEKLAEGDLVLRLQDFEEADFEKSSKNRIQDGKGLLLGYKSVLNDPYKSYYQKISDKDIVSQSIILNSNIKDKDRTLKPTKPEQYLTYTLPKSSKALKSKIFNSLNKLHLKDLVARPNDALDRLRCLSHLRNQLFLFKQKVVGMDGRNLVFMQTNGPTEAVSWIKKRTGWDLLTDIIKPSYDRAYSRREGDQTQNILKNGRFIISNDYVWEIEDTEDRIMHDVPTIVSRLQAVETVKNDLSFYRPFYTETEIEVVGDKKRLTIIDRVLDELEKEGIRKISFNTFSARCNPLLVQSIEAKTPPAKSMKATKLLKKYLEEKEGNEKVSFKTPRSDDVFRLQKGIHYFPKTQQYVATGKDNATEKQERSYRLRRIIVHRGDRDPDKLQKQLEKNLFPLLEVNFVRYRQYTVYPFPFHLIDMREEIEKTKNY